MSSSVLAEEIANFSKDADRWWDPDGPFSPLHRLNPVRLQHIKRQICAHFGREYKDIKALKGLDVIDVGCGGGLVCEPMARMGANVTGCDADAVAIEVAQAHAKTEGLQIRYKNKVAEDLVSLYSLRKQGSSTDTKDSRVRGKDSLFDVVLALEIIEHVADPPAFVESCAKLVKPGGMIIFSTLNRTAKSFALGIVAAEYILRWVPKGTHNWKQFIKPSELWRMTLAAGLEPTDISGLMFNPLCGGFEISETDIDVNYFLTAQAQ